MKLKLLPKHIDYLSEHPEHGMGYQIVDITVTSGTLLKGRVVLNSMYL